MRTETLYNILSDAIRDSDDYQSTFKRAVMGEFDYGSLKFLLSNLNTS